MKRISALIFGAIMISGCSLDKYPETTLTDQTFWKTETDLRGACNRLYVDLPGFLTGNGHDFRSDELVSYVPDDVSSGNRSVPERDNDWSDPYNKIGVCNNIIVKGGEAPLQEEVRSRWIAEARFFRAYYYFDLVKKYGDVPLILKVFTSTDDPEIKKGRDSRETVIQQCYADLEFACEWLPDIDELSDDSNWGRVSRSAALAMIVRIGLYEGTYIKYHNLAEGDSKAHLKKAIDAAQTLMSEGKHELYPNFQTLFYFDGEGRRNKENIFVKLYGPNGASNAIVYHNQSSTKATQGGITRQMIDNFLYDDGLPKGKSAYGQSSDTHYDDIFTHRDPRLAMTVFKYREADAFKGAVYRPFDNVNAGNTYAYPIKKGYMNSEFDTNGRETVDKMVIRYAEVLISYAEALYEYKGSISNDDLEKTINAVRGRSGFNVALTNEFVSANGLNMLEEIRRERMVEFIDEGLHYDDIIRWKTAEDVLPQPMLGLFFNEDESAMTRNELAGRLTEADGMYNGAKLYDQADIYVVEDGTGRSFNPDRDYLYPIPSYELATSGGNIKQNPNW